MQMTDAPHRELGFEAKSGGFRLRLKRNCSMSPAGLTRVFVALALVSVSIAIAFAAFGAWLILPFAGLEALLLGGALVVTARHAADCERIDLDHDRLSVEVEVAQRTARYELDRRRARVSLERGEGYGARVKLRDAATELEVGRHLDAEARVELASELKRRLQA